MFDSWILSLSKTSIEIPRFLLWRQRQCKIQIPNFLLYFRQWRRSYRQILFFYIFLDFKSVHQNKNARSLFSPLRLFVDKKWRNSKFLGPWKNSLLKLEPKTLALKWRDAISGKASRYLEKTNGISYSINKSSNKQSSNYTILILKECIFLMMIKHD